MKKTLGWKVGLFVFISLLMAAILIMRFSKGASLFAKTYDIILKTQNVGGIIPGAPVLMAGVGVGNVTAIELQPDGYSVAMNVRIEEKYKIHEDAHFSIKQAGFLGDRFISVSPTKNQGKILTDGAIVNCEEPFDMQEVAKSGAVLLKRMDEVAAKLSHAVDRVDTTLLSSDTLTNLNLTLRNLRIMSENALTTLGSIDGFVSSNTPSLSTSISNFGTFSTQLNQVAEELKLTVATNRVELTAAVKNIEAATVGARELLAGVQAGEGLVGKILKDESVSKDVSATLNNLSILSSNINSRGLWSVIRAPKKPKEEEKKPASNTRRK